MENRIRMFQHYGAVVTALIVALVSVYAIRNSSFFWEGLIWQLVIFTLIFVISSPAPFTSRGQIKQTAFWLLLPTIFLTQWRVDIDVFFIYSIIWIACVPMFVRANLVWWSLPLTTALWLLFRLLVISEEHFVAQTLLEATFHMFALVSATSTNAAEKANDRTQQLNRELMAAQHLLGEASKDKERTRIARDLHDLLGHHLTALTINLQVASRLSEGQKQKEVKEKIDQCHALSKLLLNDVREAVSTLREMPTVNVKELLEIATKNIPRLEFTINASDAIALDDVRLAESLLRIVQESITNTLKHSNANQALITVNESDKQLILSYSDNGSSSNAKDITIGNGLKGMRERVERIGGKLTISGLPPIHIEASLPLEQPSDQSKVNLNMPST